VSVLFLILSADARSHLATLAAISHLCQHPDFIEFLAKRPSKEELVVRIAQAEVAWAKAAKSKGRGVFAVSTEGGDTVTGLSMNENRRRVLALALPRSAFTPLC